MGAQSISACPFCADLAAGRNVVRETGPFFFRWDRYPVAEGHLLVIPRRHVELFAELSGLESQSLGSALKEAVELVKATADGVNIVINDGPAAGQTVPHLHIHVIPRWSGDVDDARGGVRGVIPTKRRY
jgi:diadenosine tetraphosphate (Ap4A) HIT family hydrolase